jgi:hypothetical protein
MSADVDHDELRMQLSQAYTRAVAPEAREHLRAALELVDPDIPTALEQCPVCGTVGLPDRIEAHDCR